MRLWPQRLDLPLRWRRARRIFVNSMSDLFHEAVPDHFIRQVFETMERADWHIFQVLTKRSDRLAWLAPRLPWPDHVWAGGLCRKPALGGGARTISAVSRPLCGFISAEPLLGPLDDLDLRGIHWVITGGESGPRPSSTGPQLGPGVT